MSEPVKMNVVSLFDGMSCGQIALDRAGIPINHYFASEVDPHAIKITRKNYPSTIHVGDVRDWKKWPIDWGKIDLIMGGSPCQGFSFAGGQLAFDHSESKLFFIFDEIVRHARMMNPKVKILLENVFMKAEFEAVITERMGVDPLKINSNLVSAQNRKRNYWFNWDAPIPVDRGITWGDIRETNAPVDHYYSDKGLDWFRRTEERTGKKMAIWPDDGKCQMLEATMYKNYSSQRFFGVMDVCGLRYMSLLECERAQTVPEGYTKGVSNTQRYKMLGNGWTVDVVAHLFKHLSGDRQYA